MHKHGEKKNTRWEEVETGSHYSRFPTRSNRFNDVNSWIVAIVNDIPIRCI